MLHFLQCNVLRVLFFPSSSYPSSPSLPLAALLLAAFLLALRYASLALGMVLPNNAKRSEISLWLQQRGQRSLFFTMPVPLPIFPTLRLWPRPVAPFIAATKLESSAKLQQWQQRCRLSPAQLLELALQLRQRRRQRQWESQRQRQRRQLAKHI